MVETPRLEGESGSVVGLMTAFFHNFPPLNCGYCAAILVTHPGIDYSSHCSAKKDLERPL
jgi:hypothetical protein